MAVAASLAVAGMIEALGSCMTLGVPEQAAAASGSTQAACNTEQEAAAKVQHLTRQASQPLLRLLMGKPASGARSPGLDQPEAVPCADTLQPSTALVGCGTSHCFPSQQPPQARHKVMWSAQAWAVAVPHAPPCPAKPTSSQQVQVYVLCNGSALGPTHAVQQALLGVPWDCFGIKALSATASTEEGTGHLALQGPQDDMRIHTLVVHLTAQINISAPGSPGQSDCMQLPDQASASQRSQHTDNGDGGSRPGRKRTAADSQQTTEPPPPLQPNARITHRVVRGAVTAAVRELKASSDGAFGTTAVESKVMNLLPKISNCLLDIIRCAHNPVLQPFICTTLNCTLDSLPEVLTTKLRTGCMQWSDAKVAHKLNQHATSTAVVGGSQGPSQAVHQRTTSTSDEGGADGSQGVTQPSVPAVQDAAGSQDSMLFDGCAQLRGQQTLVRQQWRVTAARVRQPVGVARDIASLVPSRPVPGALVGPTQSQSVTQPVSATCTVSMQPPPPWQQQQLGMLRPPMQNTQPPHQVVSHAAKPKRQCTDFEQEWLF